MTRIGGESPRGRLRVRAGLYSPARCGDHVRALLTGGQLVGAAPDPQRRHFRKHKHRMDYAGLKARGLPIGSGLVEAACKTLVAQRLKLSGMRWGTGAQAILTPRGWDQSDRFHAAWALLAAYYRAEVHVLAKVIPFTPPKPPRRSRRAG